MGEGHVVALIPARGGSKGLARKNVRPLAGKPLIAHTIQAACRAGRVERVVVSTDDQEIAEVARESGAEVPFLRPTAYLTPSGATPSFGSSRRRAIPSRSWSTFRQRMSSDTGG